MSLSIKSVAIASAVLLATVGGAFAATIDGNTPVKAGPHNWSNTVQWASDGEYVKILQCQGSYCYVKINGPDGWVKKADIDFGYGPGPFPPAPPSPYPAPGPHGCVYGPFGYICV